MLSIGYLFEEAVIEESIYSDTKEALSKYFRIDSVSNFLDLSKKVVKDGVESLSEKEQTLYRGLFDDPSVKDYVAASRRAGERDGWIRGGIIGGIGGGTIGGVAGVGSGGGLAGAIALGLLGAAAAGAALGWSMSKSLSWIRKWRAEDDIVKLGRSGGQIGKTSVIARIDQS